MHGEHCNNITNIINMQKKIFYFDKNEVGSKAQHHHNGAL